MASFRSQKLLVLEANLDDMNPEWYAPLMEKFFASGALDVTLIPILMKKGRPAVTLQVLCSPRYEQKMLSLFFEESTTLGVRSYPVKRFELQREIRKVKTSYGTVLVKIGKDQKGRVLNIAPEHSSCLTLAQQKKVPLKKVYLSALRAASL